MSAANNGGPAFPIADGQFVHRVGAAAVVGITDTAERDKAYLQATAEAATGMTLRDYFAAKAMHALILNPVPELVNGCGWEHVIAGAYQAADAMLAERAK